MESIFYSNQELFDTRSLIIGNEPSFTIDDLDRYTVSSFMCKEGVFNICYRSGTPIFITKALENPSYSERFNLFHRTFNQNLGVIVEILEPSYFENIQYLFMDNSLAQPELTFIKADYQEKCIEKKTDRAIDLDSMTLLGQDSDGTKFLYDTDGLIYLYCLDPSISDETIKMVDYQPPETLYRSSIIPHIVDVFGLIFNGRAS